MVTPDTYAPRRTLDYPYHALDNGCFNGRWRENKWRRFLERHHRERCLFAVVPDGAFHEGRRITDPAAETMRLFDRYGEVVRDAGYPVAFALQPGQRADDVPWETIEAVFIGGDTAWKLSHHALELVWAAKDHGKLAHMGRANSRKRLRRAQAMKVDTADGNFLRLAPKINGPRLRWMLESLPLEPQLALT
jgi:hypothetical protein